MSDDHPGNALPARSVMFGRDRPAPEQRSGRQGIGFRLRAAALTAGLVVAACAGPPPARSVLPFSPGASGGSVIQAPAPAVGIAASGSQSDAEAAAYGSSYAPGPGERGGTLVIGAWHAAAQLNPYYTSAGVDMVASRPVLRGCASIAPDGRYVPDLCSLLPSLANGGIEIMAASFTMTLHLKPGLLWSDGQPLTMNDLRYTWQWAIDRNQSNCSLCGAGTAWPLIGAIDVSSDGLTATLHFGQLFGGWLPWLTDPFMPEHYLSALPVKDAAIRGYPVDPSVARAPFSGPFVIASVSAGEIDYDRNPNWHGGVAPAHQGGAYLDHLRLKFFADPAAVIAAFKTGAIDLTVGLPADSYPDLATVNSEIGDAVSSSLWEYDHFGINNDPDHLRGNGLWDPKVRTALALAVDKHVMAQADFPGANVAIACSPGPPALWYRKEESCPTYNPASARALLGQAGWTPDSSGWMASNGRQMDLELCTTSGKPHRVQDIGVLQLEFAAIGVRSHAHVVDGPSVFFALWNTTLPTTDCSIFRGNYDISDFGWFLQGSPYVDWFGAYSSSQWPQLVHGWGNDTRFSNAGADAALGRLATDVSLESQLADAYTVQDAVIGATAEIPLYYWSQPTGVGAHLGNWPGFNPSPQGPTWDVEDWYYKQH